MSRPDSLRLASFAALAALVAAQWSALLAEPPLPRLLIVLAIACAGGAALSALGRAPARGRLSSSGGVRRALAAAAVALGTVAAGTLAAGLAAELLAPSGWDRFGKGVSQGVAVLADAETPYGGPDPWARLLILLALPLALGAAAALAFWPGRGRRGWALVPLLVLYGIAATLDPPPLPLAWGALLLVLVAAWLWLPQLARPAWRGALATVAVAVAAGAGAGAVLDADDPWLDWTAWRWPGATASVSFRWNHSYGPLDWPRQGTALLRAESEEPHYWRAIELDRFDGLRWEVATERFSIERPLELPSEVEGAAAGPLRPGWIEEVGFTIGAFKSGLLLAPGTVLRVDGLDGTSPGAGGTSLTSEPLDQGDAYAVTSYAPEPSARRLRAAPSDYPRPLRRYTQLELPRDLPLPEADGGLTLSRPSRFSVPLYGRQLNRRAAGMLDRSLYAGVHGLALRLTAGAEHPYDAVAAIESHLRGGYVYGESPPRRAVPLRAFLFRDRTGYCQQFSGAMALMLRTLGIPSRVASGFSSGEPEQGGGAFQVSDRDAHSWVEVYFMGIGWVPFEPTPPAAPAGEQLSELAASRAQVPAGAVIPRRGLVVPTVAGRLGPSQRSDGEGWGGVPPGLLAGLVAALAVAALAATAALARRARRYRSLRPEAAAAAQAGELRLALPRLGYPIPAGATLAELERRHRSRPLLAAHLAALRDARYLPGRKPPALAERRRLRRELGADRGLAGRLRALLALPPGGPRS